MAEEPNEETIQSLEFVGMSDVLALHADAFFVVRGGDAFTVYFFQHQVPDLTREIKKTESMETKKTKCFARIALSPIGFVSLAQALAANVDCDLVPRPKAEAKE